ncbi:MAG: nickel-dependent hydrogenase large subunit [Hydrogenimonas sp.]|nr:nickel-dependent hydrogenase large subunit [Hydrogenimonas sp.]
MKKSIELIEKIEGEAELHCAYGTDGRVVDAQIQFTSARNIEKILQGRDPKDALIINPRVCGICNHAHLIATVRALEACYKSVKISQKSQICREVTLSLELIQSHFKWFYLTIMPLLGFKPAIEKALKPSRIAAEAIAAFAGQYPHNSYAIAGGIVSDITPIELINAKERIEALKKLFKESLIDADPALFKECDKIETMLKHRGDMPLAMAKIIENGWQMMGKSEDRFIVFAEGAFKKGKSIGTRVSTNISTGHIKEESIKRSLAKRVLYKDRGYEVGPLARAMLMKTALIKESHRKYADSIFSRILARVCEIPQLIIYIESLLHRLDLSEESWIDPGEFPKRAVGAGVVEAARGSLVHKVEIEEGVIKEYNIITPTQWNLGSGDIEKPGIAQKALIGLKNSDPIELVLKSFDVCSVCTTH